jgi:hypothetical protein
MSAFVGGATEITVMVCEVLWGGASLAILHRNAVPCRGIRGAALRASPGNRRRSWSQMSCYPTHSNESSSPRRSDMYKHSEPLAHVILAKLT